jgi:hypothetical protein
MATRKRGGQPGNTNAVTHGGFSAATRAQRKAEFEEAQAKSQAWMAQVPRWNWEAIVKDIRRLRKSD